MSGEYDLVIDLLPKNSPQEIDAVRQLVSREPDAALLRSMLGLDPIRVEPVEPKVVRTRGWCEIHNIGKIVRADGGARCTKCSSRKRSERKRLEREARRAEQA